MRGRIRPLVMLARIIVDFSACLASQRFVSAVLVPGSASLHPHPSKKRAFIVEYKGPGKLTTEQADVLEARGNRYLYEINSRWTIDGTTRRIGPLRQSFVPAERQGPHGRPQGLPARHQEHQAGRRDHLQLWPRLFPQRHHAARLQMRQVPGETRRGPGQNTSEGTSEGTSQGTSQDTGEVAREGKSQGRGRKAPDLSAGFSRVENASAETFSPRC